MAVAVAPVPGIGSLAPANRVETAGKPRGSVSLVCLFIERAKGFDHAVKTLPPAAYRKAGGPVSQLESGPMPSRLRIPLVKTAFYLSCQ
jgi:hypothetical protein